MKEREPFIVVPKSEEGWPARVQEHGGQRYVALGGELYGPEEPTTRDLQQLYNYWASEHHIPYDEQNDWIVNIGRNCAKIINLQHAGQEAQHPMLDIACGTGLVGCGVLESLGNNVPYVGVDITDTMLRQASQKQQLHSAHFAQADVRQLPFAPDTFGTVTGSLFINHLTTSADRSMVFQEVRRVMQPDGLFILVDTPNNPTAREVGLELNQVFPGGYTMTQFEHRSKNAPDGFLLNYHVALKQL